MLKMQKTLTINAGEHAHSLTLRGMTHTTGYSLYAIQWSCEDLYYPVETNSNEIKMTTLRRVNSVNKMKKKKRKSTQQDENWIHSMREY